MSEVFKPAPHPASCPELPAYDASPHHRCPWVERRDRARVFARELVQECQSIGWQAQVELATAALLAHAEDPAVQAEALRSIGRGIAAAACEAAEGSVAGIAALAEVIGPDLEAITSEDLDEIRR